MKNNIISLSSVEFAQRVVNVKWLFAGLLVFYMDYSVWSCVKSHYLGAFYPLQCFQTVVKCTADRKWGKE